MSILTNQTPLQICSSPFLSFLPKSFNHLRTVHFPYRATWIARRSFHPLSTLIPFCLSHSQIPMDSDDDTPRLVQELRVPEEWLLPSNALSESEWLRVTLHKWLDDEYCPEPTNVDISKVAAKSFYDSLINKKRDLGVILLEMVSDLERISYQESFHGAFSSANAALQLITIRIQSNEQT